MDDGCTVPFSSVLAGMLLFQRIVNPTDIIRVISELSSNDIYVDDGEDLDYLFFCVDFRKDCSFALKDGYDYQTILEDGGTLYDYLYDTAGELVVQFFKNSSKYCCEFSRLYEQNYKVMIDLNKDKQKSFTKKKTKLYFIPLFVRGIH